MDRLADSDLIRIVIGCRQIALYLTNVTRVRLVKFREHRVTYDTISSGLLPSETPSHFFLANANNRSLEGLRERLTILVPEQSVSVNSGLEEVLVFRRVVGF